MASPHKVSVIRKSCPCYDVISIFDTRALFHDDVIKWKHFPGNWPFVRGIHRSPVNSPHKGQWRWALIFYLICAWINGWVNNREAGDLRRHHAHYDVTLMTPEESIPCYIPFCQSNQHISLVTSRYSPIDLCADALEPNGHQAINNNRNDSTETRVYGSYYPKRMWCCYHLTHCGLMTPCGDIELSQHWLR